MENSSEESSDEDDAALRFAENLICKKQTLLANFVSRILNQFLPILSTTFHPDRREKLFYTVPSAPLIISLLFGFATDSVFVKLNQNIHSADCPQNSLDFAIDAAPLSHFQKNLFFMMHITPYIFSIFMHHDAILRLKQNTPYFAVLALKSRFRDLVLIGPNVQIWSRKRPDLPLKSRSCLIGHNRTVYRSQTVKIPSVMYK